MRLFYSLQQPVIGLIFIFVGDESYKAALISQVIIVGVYAVLFLVNLIVNEYTIDQMKHQENEYSFIKKSSSRVKLLIDKIDDKKCSKKIERFYDILRTSPSKYNSNASTVEKEIINKISSLEDIVSSKDIESVFIVCDELISLTKKRNEFCKY